MKKLIAVQLAVLLAALSPGSFGIVAWAGEMTRPIARPGGGVAVRLRPAPMNVSPVGGGVASSIILTGPMRPEGIVWSRPTSELPAEHVSHLENASVLAVDLKTATPSIDPEAVETVSQPVSGPKNYMGGAQTPRRMRAAAAQLIQAPRDPGENIFDGASSKHRDFTSETMPAGQTLPTRLTLNPFKSPLHPVCLLAKLQARVPMTRVATAGVFSAAIGGLALALKALGVEIGTHEVLLAAALPATLTGASSEPKSKSWKEIEKFISDPFRASKPNEEDKTELRSGGRIWVKANLLAQLKNVARGALNPREITRGQGSAFDGLRDIVLNMLEAGAAELMRNIPANGRAAFASTYVQPQANTSARALFSEGAIQHFSHHIPAEISVPFSPVSRVLSQTYVLLMHKMHTKRLWSYTSIDLLNVLAASISQGMSLDDAIDQLLLARDGFVQRLNFLHGSAEYFATLAAEPPKSLEATWGPFLDSFRNAASVSEFLVEMLSADAGQNRSQNARHLAFLSWSLMGGAGHLFPLSGVGLALSLIEQRRHKQAMEDVRAADSTNSEIVYPFTVNIADQSLSFARDSRLAAAFANRARDASRRNQDVVDNATGFVASLFEFEPAFVQKLGRAVFTDLDIDLFNSLRAAKTEAAHAASFLTESEAASRAVMHVTFEALTTKLIAARVFEAQNLNRLDILQDLSYFSIRIDRILGAHTPENEVQLKALKAAWMARIAVIVLVHAELFNRTETAATLDEWGRISKAIFSELSSLDPEKTMARSAVR